MPWLTQPAVQIRSVRRVANAERSLVAVLALNRAGDRARADPRPQRLSGALTTPVALAGRLPAGLRGFGGINALESHPLPGHFKRVRVDDPGRATPNLNGNFSDAFPRCLGWSD